MEERSFVGNFLIRATEVRDKGLAGSNVLGMLYVEFCFGSPVESAAALL